MVGPEQKALLEALAEALGVPAPRPNSASPAAGLALELGYAAAARLLAAAEGHCRWGPADVGGAPAASAAAGAGSRDWALAVALLRGYLTLAPTPGGGFRPRLELQNATWRGADAAAEQALLEAAAEALGAAAPRWQPTPGSRGRSGIWVVALEGPALEPLAAAVAASSLPLGGRWPLLPEALALAAAAEAGGPAAASAAAALPDFRRRWAALPSGRSLGGQRKPPALAVFLLGGGGW